MGHLSSSGKVREVGLSKWLTLPLSAWNDVATVQTVHPNWSDATVIKIALDQLARKTENELTEQEQALLKTEAAPST